MLASLAASLINRTLEPLDILCTISTEQISIFHPLYLTRLGAFTKTDALSFPLPVSVVYSLKLTE